MKKVIFTVIVFVCSLAGVKAQEFSVGADLVSSYVWRGSLGAGTSIQPAASLEYNGLTVGAWGSVDIASAGTKEVDFFAGYSACGASFTITDYWWNGEGVQKYFNYDSHNELGHRFEASVGYTLPVEKFPLSLKWNTFFTGYDNYTVKEGELKRSYSTYIEATYPFSVKEIGLEAALGLTPWEGLYASEFSVINLSLKAKKDIKITDSFSLPVFGQIITNPRSEDIFFVFGITL
ncbi:MAG: hypothetical protein LBN18_07190 [Dysgonamonadaceae bacterium]|jgi:hypothetical protein|nr:hypothetical protein [Dysgonamonadaceae bacterium]